MKVSARRRKADRMCHFHGYSEEKAPFPCDEKLPPAKMSVYRCSFCGYIMKNGPKYTLTSFCIGVRTNPNSKAFQNSLSSPLSIHKIRSFWPSCGGEGLSEWKTMISDSFSCVGALSMSCCAETQRKMLDALDWDSN